MLRQLFQLRNLCVLSHILGTVYICNMLLTKIAISVLKEKKWEEMRRRIIYQSRMTRKNESFNGRKENTNLVKVQFSFYPLVIDPKLSFSLWQWWIISLRKLQAILQWKAIHYFRLLSEFYPLLNGAITYRKKYYVVLGIIDYVGTWCISIDRENYNDDGSGIQLRCFRLGVGSPCTERDEQLFSQADL